MTDNRRGLPNDSVLKDNPADNSTSNFVPMGPGAAGIIGQLVARSGNPETGTLVPRYGSTGLCETCLGSPDEPASAEDHPYHPVVGRTPGVHGSIDDPGRAPRNFDPATDGPGQAQVINDDPALDSAEARFRERNSRQVPYQPGEGPFAR
jgi:hypothetical protein